MLDPRVAVVSPLSLAALQRDLAARVVSPAEVIEYSLERAAIADQLGAFVVVDDERARRAAARAPRDPGPLHGVPLAVKDLVDVAGLPTARGRAKGAVASRDAGIVEALRAAGAIVIGKTRTDELGLGTLSPGVQDPRDPTRSVGGSSGGSAVAVTVGAAALAIATDTAGSARIPAAACGVAGLCAGPDSLPRSGIVTTASEFDRVGLIAANAVDLAAAWHALGGAPPSRPERIVTLASAALGQVEETRRDAAIDAARELGAVSVVERPALRDFGSPRATVITYLAAARHPINQAESPAVRHQLSAGAVRSSTEVEAARRALRRLSEELRACVGDGVLVAPTLPAAPPRWSDMSTVDDVLRTIGVMTRLCGPVNASGLAALSVPYGADADGRPIGVQLIARSEAAAFGAALTLLDSGH